MNNPSMKAARQIEDAVFLSALDLSAPDARRQFLDKACAGDDALRAVVEGMLLAQARAENFFKKGASALQLPDAGLSDPFAEPESNEKPTTPPLDEQLGKSINQYKILQ